MCGIAGAVWRNPSLRVSQLEIDWMTDALSHRGPDGRGTYRKDYENGGGFAFGHRRLAIIDVAGGNQPMTDQSKTVYVTFNGEIYNYRELRRSLESRGHVFQTDSDTETILHTYEAYGEDFVDYLRGMFAIGLWDSRLQKLILARDRLGEKPLVVSHEEDRILFASEAKALQQIEGRGTQLRPSAVDQYLRFGYIPHPWTAYEGIEKLPPGYLGVYQHGTWRTQCYWQPKLTTDVAISFEEASDRLRHALSESIQLCTRSDVPIGAFLSGGMDSTIVVGLLQQYASSPIQTFNLEFSTRNAQETEQAKQVAMRLGFDHRQLKMEHHAIDAIDKLVACFDEPFADSSAIATYYLSKWASSHVRVVMTGDGGDELFGGYARYLTYDRLRVFDRLPGLLKRMITGPWVDFLPTVHPEGLSGKLKHRLQVLRQDPHGRYGNWVNLFSRYHRESLYDPEYLRSNDFRECDQFLSEIMDRYAAERPGIRAMRADLHSYLPCDILTKVDITSMAHGLESRSPFLDHVLVEAVSEFPIDTLYHGKLLKPLLGRTFESLIPPGAMKRRKIGFNLPEDSWKNPQFTSMANDLLRNPNSFCGKYIRRDVIERMLREHDSEHINHGERLWSLVFLESWIDQFPRRSSGSDRSPLQLGHSFTATLNTN